MRESYSRNKPEWNPKPLVDPPQVPVYDLLRMKAVQKPEKPVFISFDRMTTYKELDELSDRFANVLRANGIKKGDRISFYLPNCLQALIAFFGISKAGGIVVPINVMLKQDELAYQLNDSGSRVIVTLDKLYSIVENVQNKVPSLQQVLVTNIRDYAEPGAWVPEEFDCEKQNNFPGDVWDFTQTLAEASTRSPEAYEINPRQDLFSILYTSGTTGDAKGVMLSHYNYISDCIWLICRGDWHEDDISLFLFPVFHAGNHGLVLCPSVFMGMTMVNIPKFDPEIALTLMVKYKVSVVHMPPTGYIGLLNHPSFDSCDLTSLRYCSAGGAPLAPALVKEWEKKTGVRILDAYGLTETISGLPLHETMIKNKPGATGTAGHEVKIVDKNKNIVPIETTGEIAVRGPWVALGYWKKPEETKKVLTDDGWLYTGDAGYMDEDEFVYVVDRYKDLILSSGYNVTPAEVEKAILSHEAVQEVCVYGLPDSYRGEIVSAAIVIKGGYKNKITEQDIIDYCRKQMANYKAPRYVEFISEIPKTASGKMLRRLLRDKAQDKQV